MYVVCSVIDILYERNCRLVCSAAVPLDKLFEGVVAASELEVSTAGPTSTSATSVRPDGNSVKGSDQDDATAIRVVGDGGSSGRSTTVFASDGHETEWSATGLLGVSLAENWRGQGKRSSSDSYGAADNKFAVRVLRQHWLTHIR
jgi:hypothetical protein